MRERANPDVPGALKVQLVERPLTIAIVTVFLLYLLVQFYERTTWVWLIFLLALIFGAAMTPIVRLLQRPAFPPGGWHLPVGAAVILTLLAILVGGAATAYVVGGLVVSELSAVSLALPSTASLKLNALDDYLVQAGLPPSIVPSHDSVTGAIRGAISNAFTFVRSVIPGFVSFIANFFMVLTLAAFLIVESESALGFATSLFPSSQRPLARDLLVRSGRTMGGWVLGTFIESAIVGLASGLVAWFLGLPGPALIGVLGAIIQFIPITGPILMVIPGFLLGLLQSPTVAIEAVILYALIAQLNASFLAPYIARWSVSLSPIVVIIAIPFGAALYGPIGALIAIPVAAAIQIFVTGVALPWLHRQHGEPAIVLEPEPEERRGRAA
jgi:predicted PurR-regulated permease PerM